MQMKRLLRKKYTKFQSIFFYQCKVMSTLEALLLRTIITFFQLFNVLKLNCFYVENVRDLYPLMATILLIYLQELQLHLGVLQQHAALIGGPNATSCPICHKLFLGADALMEHMKHNHKDPTPNNTATASKYLE